MVTLFHFIQ